MAILFREATSRHDWIVGYEIHASVGEGVGRIRGATPVVSLLTTQPPQPVVNWPTLMLMPPYSSAYCLLMGDSPCLHDDGPTSH